VYDHLRNINLVDPNIAYQYKDAINRTVANPFYNILPTEKFPGPLRFQPTVSILSLMKPYPQYGNINVIDGQPGGNIRYQSLQIKLQRNFTKGYSLLFGYNYHYEQDQRFYDDRAVYASEYTWIDSPSSRHRLSLAASWEVPFGKGRAYLAQAPRLLDALIGGWNLTPVVTWRSGRFMQFGGLVVNGDPHIDNPGPSAWFNTSVFAQLPAYTPRSNPWVYPGITGPGQLVVNASLVKSFHITEMLRFELRADSFNALNNISWGDPSTSFLSSTFGQSTNQLQNTFGRRTQLGLRVEF
jgi:hypothetical protein